MCTILFWSHRGRPYLWDSLRKADITHAWFYTKGDCEIVSKISLVALQFSSVHLLSHVREIVSEISLVALQEVHFRRGQYLFLC